MINAQNRFSLNSADLFKETDFAGNGAILVAVSGGGDSLALLFLLAHYLQNKGEKQRLIAVTVDHALRKESADEANYVAKLCGQIGIQHQILTWDFGADKPAHGVQEKAREGRYALLAQAAQKFKADIICLAHTKGDQAETYNMRRARLGSDGHENKIEKGTLYTDLQKRGLSAMARLSLLYGAIKLLRPLLETTRQDLRQFLCQQNISWIDDPSNDDRHYERVRIRQSLTDKTIQEACDAASKAAYIRHALNQHAALWGERLAIEQTKAVLSYDLAPLQNKANLSHYDIEAIYLLLAYSAAFVGHKNYIAINDLRLKAFVSALVTWQKGEKPQRISVSAAVLEKRQQKLFIKKEERKSAPEAVNNALQIARQKSALGPFGFITPEWDMPLFKLFKML